MGDALIPLLPKTEKELPSAASLRSRLFYKTVLLVFLFVSLGGLYWKIFWHGTQEREELEASVQTLESSVVAKSKDTLSSFLSTFKFDHLKEDVHSPEMNFDETPAHDIPAMEEFVEAPSSITPHSDTIEVDRTIDSVPIESPIPHSSFSADRYYQMLLDLLITAQSLKVAVHTGNSFQYELEHLEAVYWAIPSSTRSKKKLRKFFLILADSAHDGVQTQEKLKQDFKLLAHALVRTQYLVGEKASRWRYYASKLLSIRNVAQQTSHAIDARVAKIEFLLEEQALGKAIGEASAFEGKAEHLIAPWLDHANATHQAIEAADMLLEAVLLLVKNPSKGF